MALVQLTLGSTSFYTERGATSIQLTSDTPRTWNARVVVETSAQLTALALMFPGVPVALTLPDGDTSPGVIVRPAQVPVALLPVVVELELVEVEP